MSFLARIGSATALVSLAGFAWATPVHAVQSASAALEPGDQSGATVAKSGWWWKANDAPPHDALAGVPKLPPRTVPEGALPVAAAAGQDDMISAIEFSLAAKTGATIVGFELVLKESAEPGANVNAESAAVKACPMTTDWWGDEAAGPWGAKPSYDCDAGVEGERAASGVWSFDLTSVASGWVTEGNEFAPAIVLVPDFEEGAPDSFQVSFAGQDANGIGTSLTHTGGATGGTGDGTGGTTDPGDPATGTDASGDAPTNSPLDLVGDLIDSGTPAGADLPLSPDPVTGEAAPTGSAPNIAAGSVQPSVFDSLPMGSWLLLPIAAGLAYLIMLALGPAAQPTLATSRHGVGRALERWRTSGVSVPKGDH